MDRKRKNKNMNEFFFAESYEDKQGIRPMSHKFVLALSLSYESMTLIGAF